MTDKTWREPYFLIETLGQEVGIVVYCAFVSEKGMSYFFKQNPRVLLYSPSILWWQLNFGCATILIRFCLNILAYVSIA